MRTSDYAGLILERWRTFVVAFLVVVLGGVAAVLVVIARDSTVEADARIEATGVVRERERYAVDSQSVAFEAIKAAEAALGSEPVERRARAALGLKRTFAALEAQVNVTSDEGTAALVVTVSGKTGFPTADVATWYSDEAVAMVTKFAEARLANPEELSVAITEPVALKDRPMVRRAVVAAVLIVLGMLGGIGAALVRGLVDPRVRFAVDARRAHGEATTVVTASDGGINALAALVATATSDDGPTVTVVRSLEGYDEGTTEQLAVLLREDGHNVQVVLSEDAPGSLRQVSERAAGAARGDILLVDVRAQVAAVLAVPAIQVADLVIVGLRRGASQRRSLTTTVRAVDLLDPAPATVFHLV